MTLEQLKALPIVNGFKQRMLPNGITENYRDTPVFLARRPEDYIAISDDEGNVWQTGLNIEGVLCKERSFLEGFFR